MKSLGSTIVGSVVTVSGEDDADTFLAGEASVALTIYVYVVRGVRFVSVYDVVAVVFTFTPFL